MKRTVVVVQDHETGGFLAPADGSVRVVRLIRDAGEFDDEESAVLTAADWCDYGFSVVQIIKGVA